MPQRGGCRKPAAKKVDDRQSFPLCGADRPVEHRCQLGRSRVIGCRGDSANSSQARRPRERRYLLHHNGISAAASQFLDGALVGLIAEQVH